MNRFGYSDNPSLSYPMYPPYTINMPDNKDSKVKLSTYDGLTPFTDFKVQFEMVAKINKWDKEKMAYQLAGCLKDDARGILSNLNDTDREDYDKLVAALKDRFEPDNQQNVFRMLLRKRVRQSNESLPKLAQEIRTLYRKAFPKAGLDEEGLVQYFIDSLTSNSEPMAWYVQSSEPDTLSAAVNLAVQYEAFHATKEDVKGNQSLRGIGLSGTGNKTPSSEDNKKSNVKCFNCGLTGHMIKDCKKPREKPCGNCKQTGHSYRECPQPKKLCSKCLGFGHESGDCRITDDKAADMRKQREDLLNKYVKSPAVGYQQPKVGYQQPKPPKTVTFEQTQSEMLKDIFGSMDNEGN